MKSEITQHWYENKNAAVDAQGLVYYFLDQSRLDYCGGGSRKFCRFLDKYDGTIWADAENYYSDFSDIKFSNNPYFISFFNLDNTASYCEGWKVGETAYGFEGSPRTYYTAGSLTTVISWNSGAKTIASQYRTTDGDAGGMRGYLITQIAIIMEYA